MKIYLEIESRGLDNEWAMGGDEMEDAEVTPMFLPESTRRIPYLLKQRKTEGYTDLECSLAGRG